MPGVERRQVLWTIVVFFGASIVFNAIQDASRDEGLGTMLGLQVVALVAIVIGLVVFVRRRGG